MKTGCVGEELPEGYARLDDVQTPLPFLLNKPPDLSSAAEDAVRAYIPGAVLSKISAGQANWLAELRQLTVLFINLPDIDHETNLETAQKVMQSLQKALYRYEGSVNKISVDDKGTTLVAALGMPPLFHVDDPMRGVQAALAMQTDLKAINISTKIGITTGRTFCGSVGGASRREYTMIGDVVNLAARLMQAATTAHSCLCDGVTYKNTSARIAFKSLPAIQVKGKTGLIPIYQPLGEKVNLGTTRPLPAIFPENHQNKEHTLIGRQEETALLSEKLFALKENNLSGVVLIEGSAGLGKSHLIAWLIEQAAQNRVTAFYGLGDAIQKSTAYYAWQGIFSQMLDLEILTDPDSRRRHVLDLLEDFPHLLDLAPLLNAVISLELPDNDLTSQMSGQVRADNTRNVLLQFLQESVSFSPKILIMEDVQWLDSASWALLLAAYQSVKPLLLVLSTRPQLKKPTPEYNQFLQIPSLIHINLDSLSIREIVTLVCQKLQVSSLPAPVINLLQDKAEGNPLYTEEMIYALQDREFIHLKNGKCVLNPQANGLSQLDLPDTLQGMIISRIDRLSPAQQLTLKVASVIGRVFSLKILHAIHPVETERQNLVDTLKILDSLEITTLEVLEPDPVYTFKQVIIQEVAYNLMLFSQRRALHQAIASWYEESQADDLSPYYPILAHHWGKTDDITRTQAYLEKSGIQALRSGAYQEAVDFFEQVLVLVTQAEEDISSTEQLQPSSQPSHQADVLLPPQQGNDFRFQKANWERQLGEAYLGLGRVEDSRRHLENALQCLNQPLPKAKNESLFGISQQIGRQGWYGLRYLGLRNGQVANPQAKERLLLLEAVRAYTLLTEVYYFTNQTLDAIYATLRGLNLAEALGPSPELARAYANMRLAMGILRLHHLARFYGQRAQDIAQSTGDQMTLARIYTVTGLYNVGCARLDEARKDINRALRVYNNLEDRVQLGESLAIMAYIHYFRGEFSRCADYWGEIHTGASRSSDFQQQTWGFIGQAEVEMRLANPTTLANAHAYAASAEVLLSHNIGQIEALRVNGVLAIIYLMLQDWDMAQNKAEQVLALIDQSFPGVMGIYEGWAGPTEVYLTLYERAIHQADDEALRHTLQKKADQACQTFQRYGRVFAVGRPRALFYQGWYQWLSGQSQSAYKLWQKGLKLGEDLNLPYEVARLHQKLALLDVLDANQQEAHLVQAHEIFDRLKVFFKN